ncbi:MAG: hypothetical protein WC895_02090 [Candidatus Shapirobacteria bacterium]|jgi:hypothetical protein
MEKIKKIFLVIIGIIILTSTLLNIKNQYLTLKDAENKNAELISKIEKLVLTKQKIQKQIEYATSSAFKGQQTRQLLGLGDNNDVWLELSEEKKIDFYQKTNEVIEVPKYRQWLNLFTQ